MKSKKKTRSVETEQEVVIKHIAARLKALRLEKGHSSYEKFAYDNNIDRSQYGKYERGADMRISSLVKILVALDVTVEEFFAEGFKE